MRRREHEWCVLLLAFITSCGHYVMPDGASDSGGTDAIAAPDTRDASVRDTRDAEDVRDAMDAMDAMDVEDASDVVDVDVFGPDADDADVRDASTTPDVTDVTDVIDAGDVTDASDASVGCVAPSDPRPARSLRSCTGPGAAPPEHCREVWHCGGSVQMGSTSAFNHSNNSPLVRQTATCHVARAQVHPSFLDAYEVSVARFRTWIRAGTPQPAANASYWTNPLSWWEPQRFDVPNYSCRGAATCVRPDPDNCSYTDIPGARDDSPINCLTPEMMIAFCWWEGKHLASEGLWEAVATNGGRTALPFSDRLPPGMYDPCLYGDVDGCVRVRQLPRPFESHPLGQSVDPSSVFGLWGGVREYTWSYPRDASGCLTPGQTEGESRFIRTAVRGRSYRDTGTTATQFDHAATRWDASHVPERDPSIGFRCARWLTEPWE